ncbi:unnamed protein product [Camellia sinensis]
MILSHILTQSQSCFATDNLTQSKSISVSETLTSASQIFELGFFNSNSTAKKYVGIWYKKIPIRKVVWVANRENPLSVTDSGSSLTIGDDGNLRLLDGNQNTVWTTNMTAYVNYSVAVLLDTGNLVLRDGASGESLWEGFSHPCDTSLPGMRLGLNTRTGEKLFLTAWKTEDDPSPGKFVSGISPEKPPQEFIWNNSINSFLEKWAVEWTQACWDTGNTWQLSKWVYSCPGPPTSGALRLVEWDEGTQEWNTHWNTLDSLCDIYGTCGPFGVCNRNKSPICKCLKGFVPKSNEEWGKGNWTSGCVRRTELLCDKNTSNSSSGSGKIDGFWKLRGMKLPDLSTYVPLDDTNECKLWCLNNCSCLEFSLGGEDLFLRLANSELGKGKERTKLIVSLVVISSIILSGVFVYVLCKWKAKQRGKRKKISKASIFSGTFYTSKVTRLGNLWRNHVKQQDPSELPIFDFDKIVAATNNFCSDNKLGEGGFGPVFKGKLEDGQEIAVKKLSRCSGQGIGEFKNEIILMSKLQHRNLVQLFGCCIEGEELMIVYEYMPNRSLDTFFFDPTRRAQLDWDKRFNIIQGIARGLMYLHRDSCLKIIHRDLKASNVLLDKDMNPKISDFGMARTFQVTQELANTRRVVGTYFGVLLLETVSGMKNTSFHYHEQYLSLLGYAWQLWNEGRVLDFMDQTLTDSCFLEVQRCISIGLLCVQDHAADRPTMPDIVLMLRSDTNAPTPKQPIFTFRSLLYSDKQTQCNNFCSINEVTAWHLWNKSRALDLVDEAMAESCLLSEVMRCIRIGLLCVQNHVTDRPTMSAVVLMLSSEIDVPQPKQPTFTIQSLYSE